MTQFYSSGQSHWRYGVSHNLPSLELLVVCQRPTWSGCSTRLQLCRQDWVASWVSHLLTSIKTTAEVIGTHFDMGGSNVGKSLLASKPTISFMRLPKPNLTFTKRSAGCNLILRVFVITAQYSRGSAASTHCVIVNSTWNLAQGAPLSSHSLNTQWCR